MALNSTGQISLGGATAGESIALELGQTATSTISLGDTAVKTLGGFASSLNVDMGAFRGATNRKQVTYSFNQNSTQTTVNVSAIFGYIAGKTDVTISVAAGKYLYSTSTSVAALNVNGGASGDTITVINDGYIIGMGGKGGTAYMAYGGGNINVVCAGNKGGPAISFAAMSGVTLKVTNNTGAYTAGGGGGGGGMTNYGSGSSGGGGAGGGFGGDYLSASYTLAAGGAGGAPGATGSDGTDYKFSGVGGGGGRILPGTGGVEVVVTGTYDSFGGNYKGHISGKGGGAGGSGGALVEGDINNRNYTAHGGAGGSGANAGSDGYGTGMQSNSGGGPSAGGGGGWGASGGQGRGGLRANYSYLVPGGTGGYAIAKNGNPTVTTNGPGTIYGQII